MTATAPMLEVTGLTKRFGGLVAVRDMRLSIRSGEIVGLIGPNGSGKSTVMKLVMGILRPDAVHHDAADGGCWNTGRASCWRSSREHRA